MLINVEDSRKPQHRQQAGSLSHGPRRHHSYKERECRLPDSVTNPLWPGQLEVDRPTKGHIVRAVLWGMGTAWAGHLGFREGGSEQWTEQP